MPYLKIVPQVPYNDKRKAVEKILQEARESFGECLEKGETTEKQLAVFDEKITRLLANDIERESKEVWGTGADDFLTILESEGVEIRHNRKRSFKGCLLD